MKVKITDLEKSFGEKKAVNIENLTINDNEILGIVGNNGAGKTTLFKLMLDLLKPDKGTVELTFKKGIGSTFTTNVRVDEDWKSHTGAYIDESFLIDFLTPEEYFEFVAKANNVTKEELSNKLNQFKTFANNELFNKNKLIRNMSAGNKQKIGIISAFINSPQLVILDEPFNFLDPTSQNNLKQILQEYKEQTNSTIIISSHNLSHTIDISDRIIVMEYGDVVRDIKDSDKDVQKELEQYFNR